MGNEGYSRSLIWFDVLQVVGLVLTLLVLLPATFSNSIARMKTWFGLLISCVVYCVSFLLLFGHQTGPEPSLALCTVQAGLVYAAPPIVAAAAALFVIELYLRLSCTISRITLKEVVIERMLWCMPYLHVFYFCEAVIFGLTDINTIERDPSGFYCHIKQRGPTTVTGVSVVLLVLLMVCVEVLTVRRLVRHRVSLRALAVSASGFQLSLFVRISVYTLVGGFAAILTIVAQAESQNWVFNLALIPLPVAILFGSQSDVVRVYLVCKRRRSYRSS